MVIGATGLMAVMALVLYVMFRSPRPRETRADLCELVRTNNAVLISAIEAMLLQAHIPHVILDLNMSVLEGSVGVLPRRVLVHRCCAAAARGLLVDAGLGHELNADAG
jgi:hypothetical protein